jgi:hypothetical protein
MYHRLTKVRVLIFMKGILSTSGAVRVANADPEHILSSRSMSAIVANPPTNMGDLMKNFGVRYFDAQMIFNAIKSSDPIELPSVEDVWGSAMSRMVDRFTRNM